MSRPFLSVSNGLAVEEQATSMAHAHGGDHTQAVWTSDDAWSGRVLHLLHRRGERGGDYEDTGRTLSFPPTLLKIRNKELGSWRLWGPNLQQMMRPQASTSIMYDDDDAVMDP